MCALSAASFEIELVFGWHLYNQGSEAGPARRGPDPRWVGPKRVTVAVSVEDDILVRLRDVNARRLSSNRTPTWTGE
jgi:hypothetical protein